MARGCRAATAGLQFNAELSAFNFQVSTLGFLSFYTVNRCALSLRFLKKSQVAIDSTIDPCGFSRLASCECSTNHKLTSCDTFNNRPLRILSLVTSYQPAIRSACLYISRGIATDLGEAQQFIIGRVDRKNRIIEIVLSSPSINRS